MSEFKISGMCSICDQPCFEILQWQDENDRHPGEPKRLGPPLGHAIRVTFALFDGTMADFTFCGDCAETLHAEQYDELWKKALRSWRRQIDGEYPAWFVGEFSNAIARELGRKKWTEVLNA